MTTQKLPIKQPLLVNRHNVYTSWDQWLYDTDAKLKELGYVKYTGQYKLADFYYRKCFKNEESKFTYQIGVLFYDFRKCYNNIVALNRIDIMYECLLSGEDRIDLSVSKDIELITFEKMAHDFQLAMFYYL